MLEEPAIRAVDSFMNSPSTNNRKSMAAKLANRDSQAVKEEPPKLSKNKATPLGKQ